MSAKMKYCIQPREEQTEGRHNHGVQPPEDCHGAQTLGILVKQWSRYWKFCIISVGMWT